MAFGSPLARIPARVLPGLLLVMLAAAAARADDPYAVDARGGMPRPARDPARVRALDASPAWERFLAAHPGWVARWSETDGVPERAQGPAVPLARVPRDAADAETLTRDFVRRELGAWVDAGDLVLVRAVPDGNGWWVQYAGTHRGLRVVGEKTVLRVTRDGAVARFAVDAAPGIAVADARVPEARARGLAAAGIPHDLDLDVEASELVVLPVAGGHRTAYEVRFHAVNAPGAWLAYVDAADETLLWRTSTLRHAAVSGAVRGAVRPLRPTDAGVDVPFPYLGVSLADTATVYDETVSGPGGAFSLTAPGAGEGYAVHVPFQGPYGKVVDASDAGATPVLVLPVAAPAEGVDADLNGQSQDRTAFHWCMASRDFIRAVDPAFTLLDYEMPIVVDLPGQECNAFWNGVGVTFYPAGGSCRNTGDIPSVVIHEYGHGITDFAYRPFAPSGAMHEGFSDYTSAALLGDPVIGHGFFQNGGDLRRIDVDRVYPRDATGQAHNDGLIIAGALWDVRTSPVGAARTDSLWHFARFGLSTNFDDYFMDFLLTDDTDGDVFNGTPNFNHIVAAFKRHGIGDYSVSVSHLPLRDTEDTGRDNVFTAVFVSLYPIVESTAQAHLRITTGGETTILTAAMSPTGATREYRYDLGPLPEDTEVAYWLTARNADGAEVVHPEGGEAVPLRFRVGADAVPPAVSHRALQDQPVDTEGIAVRARVTDNLDRPVSAVRVTYARNQGPESTLPMAPLGGDAFQAALPALGLGLGDAFRYRIEAVDGAAGANTTRIPQEGWLEFGLVQGFSRDFDATPGGLVGGGDWEWGEPPSVPDAAGGVWGTVLDRNYADQTASDLVLGPFDLTGFAAASLGFRHAYWIEASWDGGTVQASADGAAWTTLVPDGGYPYASVTASLLPAFSGTQAEWTEAEFDLGPYAGLPQVWVRFRFVTDQAVNDRGWFVDDVSVVDRQLLARPLRVRTRSGHDGAVPVSWSPPVGIPLGEGSALLGYHVYRARPGEGFQRATGEPVTDTRFTDTGLDNGLAYTYAVTGVYARGESPVAETSTALPYRAVFAGPADSLFAVVAKGDKTTLPLALANAGTGYLKTNVWVGEPGAALDKIRIRYDVPEVGWTPPAPAAGPAVPPPPPLLYQTLFVDGRDNLPALVPDLREVQMQRFEDKLYLRLTSYLVWGDPGSAFTLRVLFDTDGDLGTGVLGDVHLLAGAKARADYGREAVLLDDAGEPVAAPHHVDLALGMTAAVFGFTLDDLGRPERVVLTVQVLSPSGNVIRDRAPERPPAWVEASPPGLSLFQGTAGLMELQLSSTTLPFGTARASIHLETNDPGVPLRTLPLAFAVTDPDPVRLVAFTADAEDLGVVLRWEVAAAFDHAGFHVLRDDGSGERRVNQALIPPSADGLHRYEDRAVEPGRHYVYRLAEVARDGTRELFGPVSARYDGALALARPVLRANVPNPFRGDTRLRFGLPRSASVRLRVFGVDGGLVRTLAGGGERPAGFHELVWDGRDDGGRRVAPGVYLVRFEADGTREDRKLVLVP